jgi:hypothetical protein
MAAAKGTHALAKREVDIKADTFNAIAFLKTPLQACFVFLP